MLCPAGAGTPASATMNWLVPRSAAQATALMVNGCRHRGLSRRLGRRGLPAGVVPGQQAAVGAQRQVRLLPEPAGLPEPPRLRVSDRRYGQAQHVGELALREAGQVPPAGQGPGQSGAGSASG